MIDPYVQNVIKRVKIHIEKERYFNAGQLLMDLGRVGIIADKKLLVTISTELADVFRNSLEGVSYYVKEFGESELKFLLNHADKLLNLISDYDKDYSEKERVELLDLMIETIFLAEKIQDSIRELRIPKGALRRDLIL